MGITREMFKWIFQNILPGETNPEKRVDAERIMDNYRDLAAAIAGVEARGTHAADGNSRGFSTTTQCNLTLKTPHGQTGLIDYHDHVQISDGANKWYLRNDVADDELSFSDTDLAEGGGPADYSAPAFISSLIIQILKFRPKIGKPDLVLTGAHADKITGVDIETNPLDATPLGAKVTELQDRVDISLDGEGKLKSEAVDSSAFAAAALLDDGFENILWGQFDTDADNDGLANGWVAYNTPTCAMDLGIYRIGTSSQQVTASQPEDGIAADATLYRHQDFAGDFVAFSAWIYADDDNSVILEIYDGRGSARSLAGGHAGTWVRLAVERQLAADATELSFRIFSDRSTTFRVDGAMAKRGRLHPGYTANHLEIGRTHLAGDDFANWLLNSDFHDWSNGYNQLPDFWKTGGTLLAPASIQRNTSAFLFGDAALQVTLGLGQGFYQAVDNWQDFRGHTIYISGYFYAIASAGLLRLTIDDGVMYKYLDFVPPFGDYRRPGCVYEVSVNATRLRLSISNVAGGTVEFLCDGLMLTRGSFPTAYQQSRHTHAFKWDFVFPGTIAAGLGFREGAQLDIFPVPDECIVHRIRVYESAAPAIGPDVFTVSQNGTATFLTATVAGGSQTASAHNPVAFTRGDRIQVIATPGIAPGENAGVTVEGYRLGC